MRYIKYFFIIFILLQAPVVFAQQSSMEETDITGLWKGTIFNDTTQKFYKYEMGISEEKGKLTGYSYTWYDENNYFVVRKVKIKKKDGKIIIEDVDIVAYNFPETKAKSVHKIHVLTLETQDSILVLTGTFVTNRTKTYTPVTGSIRLQRKNDYRRQSDLMAHLQELKLDNDLSFVARDIAIAKEEEEKALTKSQVKVDGAVPANNTDVKDIAIKTPAKTKVDIKAVEKSKTTEPEKKAETTKPVAVKTNAAPAAEVLTRKNVLQETMTFKSDSLELALYDNGEVDGDTVSVLMNGSIIMAKQGLSTNAIRKTIYIPATMDSVELVMYAETLGTLPPNSGLLVIRDGRDLYEVRFSGDLQKNATIILKRRKN